MTFHIEHPAGAVETLRSLVHNREAFWCDIDAPRKATADPYEDTEVRALATLDVANLISSHVVGRDGRRSFLHLPVLDIDRPVDEPMLAVLADVFPGASGVWVPSTTEGHGHLYVQDAFPETDYMVALMRLAVAGVIEAGYALVSIRRRATFVRLPWVAKPSPPAAEEVPW